MWRNCWCSRLPRALWSAPCQVRRPVPAQGLVYDGDLGINVGVDENYRNYLFSSGFPVPTTGFATRFWGDCMANSSHYKLGFGGLPQGFGGLHGKFRALQICSRTTPERTASGRVGPFSTYSTRTIPVSHFYVEGVEAGNVDGELGVRVDIVTFANYDVEPSYRLFTARTEQVPGTWAVELASQRSASAGVTVVQPGWLRQSIITVCGGYFPAPHRR
jgi:hypothetical protein